MSIAATVITKNEAAMIRACLDSLSWVDEIVVVDSGSTDRTVDICREYTDKIMQTDWPGFGPQKNRAIEMATSEWILSLDADERVTPELREELRAAMADAGNRSAFSMPRLSSYCGKPMRHSGWWPDYVTRLFRRGQACFSDDLVHERLLVEGPVGRLREPLLHEAFSDLDEVLDTMNRYSTAGARMMQKRKEKAGLSTALLHGLWSFLNTYFLRIGFLDGREGFMLAISNAEGTYYKYLKLMLMLKKK